MGHSYRQDQADNLTSSGGGPTVVTGSKVASQPVSGAAASQADIDAQHIANNPTKVYTADGAITIQSGTHVISKTSAAAMTLAAPTTAQNGLTLRFIAGTAFAHVVTATGLIDDGVTGGAKNTLTMGAFVGATATLQAYNAHWVLLSKTVATVA